MILHVPPHYVFCDCLPRGTQQDDPARSSAPRASLIITLPTAWLNYHMRFFHVPPFGVVQFIPDSFITACWIAVGFVRSPGDDSCGIHRADHPTCWQVVPFSFPSSYFVRVAVLCCVRSFVTWWRSLPKPTWSSGHGPKRNDPHCSKLLQPPIVHSSETFTAYFHWAFLVYRHLLK
jgi:hypothetical protein